MEFKQEFVKLIVQNIKEQEKRDTT